VDPIVCVYCIASCGGCNIQVHGLGPSTLLESLLFCFAPVARTVVRGPAVYAYCLDWEQRNAKRLFSRSHRLYALLRDWERSDKLIPEIRVNKSTAANTIP